MIRVVAKHFAKEDKLNEILELYKELVQKSRNDEGCISYELLQDLSNAKILTIVEQWETKEALDKHMNESHFKILVPKISEMLESGTEINIYKQLL